ncbi:hypothetical protein AG0111_0g12760 [Alternaria gaisen]|uniref:Uncharacterized protein n=1 Tax=Alternaria gaisen TaxID=167740 RepID=A0ACB6F3M3_9PLEO|nr:hypothetical protein AG0111_0g12760 [Alternaria gaisen]
MELFHLLLYVLILGSVHASLPYHLSDTDDDPLSFLDTIFRAGNRLSDYIDSQGKLIPWYGVSIGNVYRHFIDTALFWIAFHLSCVVIQRIEPSLCQQHLPDFNNQALYRNFSKRSSPGISVDAISFIPWKFE